MIYIYYEYMSYGYPVTSAVYYNKPVKHRLDRFIALRYINKTILKYAMVSPSVKITYIINQDGDMWRPDKTRRIPI